MCVCLHICVLLCSFSISRFDWECLFYIPFFVWLVESTQVASALLAAIFACELQAGDTGKTPLMQTRVSGQVCASFCEEAKKTSTELTSFNKGDHSCRSPTPRTLGARVWIGMDLSNIPTYLWVIVILRE